MIRLLNPTNIKMYVWLYNSKTKHFYISTEMKNWPALKANMFKSCQKIVYFWLIRTNNIITSVLHVMWATLPLVFIKEIVSVPCRLSRGSGLRAVTVSAEATGGTQNSRPATIATQKASVRVRAHHAEWRSASRYCDYQSRQGMIVIRKYTDMIAVIGRLKQ